MIFRLEHDELCRCNLKVSGMFPWFFSFSSILHLFRKTVNVRNSPPLALDWLNSSDIHVTKMDEKERLNVEIKQNTQYQPVFQNPLRFFVIVN